MRLTRAREGRRYRLGGFLLPPRMVYREGKSRWTRRHFDWIEALQFEHPEARDTMIEYLDAVRDAGDRVARVGKRVGEAVSGADRSSRRSSRCAGSTS